MTTISATEARKQLCKPLDEVAQAHEPIQITGKRGNAVLVSEGDLRAVQETLYLVSIPGMRASILEGMATPVSGRRPGCSSTLSERSRCSRRRRMKRCIAPRAAAGTAWRSRASRAISKTYATFHRPLVKRSSMTRRRRLRYTHAGDRY